MSFGLGNADLVAEYLGLNLADILVKKFNEVSNRIESCFKL